ncbi:MAG: hypothetical protein ACP5QU_09425 [Anaerolineae bacterium]
MKQSTLSVRLSTEELLLILWLLNVPTLPGMGGNPFGEASEEQIAAALSSAERSLRARRLIGKTEKGKIQMDEVVMALVGTCAVPEFSVVLTQEAPDTGRVIHYFHATKLLAVEHSNPEPGIHVFEALPDANVILTRLEELMQLAKQGAPSAKPVQTTMSVLQRATQAAQRAAREAKTILIEAGMERQTATTLSQTLTHMRRRSAVVAIHNLREASSSSDGLVILEGENSLWAMQIDGENDSAMVYLWGQSAADIRLRLQELIHGEQMQFA